MLTTAHRTPRGAVLILAMLFAACLAVMTLGLTTLVTPRKYELLNTEARYQAVLVSEAGMAEEISKLNDILAGGSYTPNAAFSRAWGGGQTYVVSGLDGAATVSDLGTGGDNIHYYA